MIETSILMVVALGAIMIIAWSWRAVVWQHRYFKMNPYEKVAYQMRRLGVASGAAADTLHRYAEILAKIEERHNV